ncbi:nuclear envelope, Cut8 family [Olea europaea subsp. europaea]|uniref:Nuclear envelope, Cut8 family n=1 Tax=Olea europaea subsp. europaea TaxID=158383 RepID=A0A8S0SF07_OLEEU|nr:nuclear envelope, Cut8 family [Olea europaea subsp. europaea]
MAQVSSSSPYKSYPAFLPPHSPANFMSNQANQQPRTLGFGAFNPLSNSNIPSSALAFGFGQSAAGSSAALTAGWRTPPAGQQQLVSPFPSSAGAAGSSNQQPSSNRRKRRSSSSPEPDEQDAAMGEAQSPSRAKQGTPRAISVNKRARKAELGKEKGVGPQPAQADDGVDIAALPKPALLQMFNSLLTTQPELRPTLLSLIPPPSLESFTETLSGLEHKLIQSIPQGRHVRQEYIWGRTRVPLEEYLAEARHALAVFLPPSNEDHPSTTFNFLLTLTTSVKKVENLLPSSANTGGLLGNTNPLVAHLVPGLMNAWHVFITRLSHQVNKQGKIMSAESVRTRFRLLDELCAGGEGVTRKAMEDVRDRMGKEIGWLAGNPVQQIRAQSVEMMDEEL